MKKNCGSYATTTRKKLVYLKPHDSVPRPVVSRYGLKTFLCIFWNYLGVLHDRLLEMGLMVTPYVRYHKLTKVANNILFPLRQDIAKLQALTLAR